MATDLKCLMARTGKAASCAEVERSEGEVHTHALPGNLQSAAADVQGTSAEAVRSVPGSNSISELIGSIHS